MDVVVVELRLEIPEEKLYPVITRLWRLPIRVTGMLTRWRVNTLFVT